MNKITICLAYYLNPGMLAAQYANLASLPAELKAHLRLIVVDDGSPHDPATPPAADIGVPVEIFRVMVDVRWNQDAARNIAAHEAPEGWLLLTDIDHVPPERTLRYIIRARLSLLNVYRFARVSAPDMTPYKPHPNSWLITRDMYWTAGGYEERTAGFYGTDGPWRDQVKAAVEWANGLVVVLKDPLIRYPREVIADASTTTYERKTDADRANIGRIRAEIAESGDLKPHVLTFPWERVA